MTATTTTSSTRNECPIGFSDDFVYHDGQKRRLQGVGALADRLEHETEEGNERARYDSASSNVRGPRDHRRARSV